MKKIHEITINKTELVDKTEIIKDDKGAEITQIKKVEELVPHKYFIARPTRYITDESEIFRASTESEYIRRGVISASLLQRRLVNDGGVLTEEDKKEYETLRNLFISKQSEYAKLIEVQEVNRTPEQNTEIEKYIKELGEIIDRMGKIENSSSSLFNRTSEALARNKTVLWLMLHLAFEEKSGKNVPVFGDGDYEAKLKKYDEIEEREDDYEYSLVKKLLLIVSVWYMGKATTKDEFDTILRIQDSPLGI